MPALIKRALRMQRFQVALLVVILSMCTYGILSFIEKIEATVEQSAVRLSLNNIQNIIALQAATKRVGDSDCHLLDDPNLFFPPTWTPPLVSVGVISKPRTANWRYDVRNHRATYDVSATHYFHSSIGPRIEVNFLCKEGTVIVHISPYHWCENWHLWGCH